MERVKKWFQTAVRSPIVLSLVIFVLALGPRLTDLAVFVGPDEFTWDLRSANFARAIASGDLIETYQDGYPGVTLMWAETVGAWLRYGVQWLNGSSDWDAIIGPDKTAITTLAGKRQVLASVNTLLVVAYVLLVYRVFGISVAWLAGFLLAFDPFLLTESRVLRSEAIMTGFNALALLGFLLYLCKQRIKYGVLAGVLTGLAILSKVSAVALLPVGGLIIAGVPLFDQTRSKAERWRATVITVLTFGTALLITIVIFWPALWVAPIEIIWKMYGYVGVRVTEGNEGGVSFFFGSPYSQKELSSWFYPVVLLYRSSPLTWLGMLLLALMVWPARRLSLQQKVLVGAILGYLAIYLALITNSVLKYDRFIVPVLPILNLMAALGLATAWQYLSERITRLRQFGWSIALLVLVGQMSLALPYHPYYYAYWNPVLGGIKQAMRLLPIGTGGEGIDQVVAYLNSLPNSEELSLASLNSQKVKAILNGETLSLDNLDGMWTQADYVMIYISQLQRGKHAEDILEYLKRRQPEYILKLDGIEYAWLYPGPAAQYYGGGHKLEGRGTLFGYNLSATTLTAGETLTTTLYWRNEGQREDDRFFVRLKDLDGYVWTEAIAQPRPGFEEAARYRPSIVESEAILSLPVGMPPGDYFFKLGFRTDKGKIIGYFELPADTKPLTVTTARVYPSPGKFEPPHPVQFSANTDLTLLGYDVTPKELTSGSAIWLTLYWQALTDVSHDYVILLRLLDSEQQELAFWFGRPVRSGYHTTEWRAGQIIQDPWLLEISPEIKSRVNLVEIAVYDAATEQEVSRKILGEITLE
ncbi:MAG: glycosyltransferase family 39 protein [Anaerolineae bacterium]|nr:glycosyltransferase family 39 protein [Anaerolineae bacterium]